MSEREAPSEPGHSGSGEGTPPQSDGSDERELTEYTVPAGEREKPGARERERRES